MTRVSPNHWRKNWIWVKTMHGVFLLEWWDEQFHARTWLEDCNVRWHFIQQIPNCLVVETTETFQLPTKQIRCQWYVWAGKSARNEAPSWPTQFNLLDRCRSIMKKHIYSFLFPQIKLKYNLSLLLPFPFCAWSPAAQVANPPLQDSSYLDLVRHALICKPQ